MTRFEHALVGKCNQGLNLRAIFRRSKACLTLEIQASLHSRIKTKIGYQIRSSSSGDLPLIFTHK